jgi:HSP20 family protein
MVKSTPKKKSSGITPWTSSWSEIDRSIDNLRKDMEKAFSSFPSIQFPTMPKMAHTSCDLIDEGKQFRVKMDIPGVKRDEIKLEVTDNSLEVSAEHKEQQNTRRNLKTRKRIILEKKEVTYPTIGHYLCLKK